MITSGSAGQGNEDHTATLGTLGWEGLYATTVSLSIWTKRNQCQSAARASSSLWVQGWEQWRDLMVHHGGQRGRFWPTEPDPLPQPGTGQLVGTGAGPVPGIGQLPRDGQDLAQ